MRGERATVAGKRETGKPRRSTCKVSSSETAFRRRASGGTVRGSSTGSHYHNLGVGTLERGKKRTRGAIGEGTSRGGAAGDRKRSLAKRTKCFSQGRIAWRKGGGGLYRGEVSSITDGKSGIDP